MLDDELPEQSSKSVDRGAAECPQCGSNNVGRCLSRDRELRIMLRSTPKLEGLSSSDSMLCSKRCCQPGMIKPPKGCVDCTTMGRLRSSATAEYESRNGAREDEQFLNLSAFTLDNTLSPMQSFCQRVRRDGSLFIQHQNSIADPRLHRRQKPSSYSSRSSRWSLKNTSSIIRYIYWMYDDVPLCIILEVQPGTTGNEHMHSKWSRYAGIAYMNPPVQVITLHWAVQTGDWGCV